MQQPLFIYADYLPAATVTATDAASGYPADKVLQANEDTSWKPVNTTGSKSLTFDLSVALSRGAVGICGEQLNNVTVEVRASTDNFAASDVQIVAPAVMSSYIAAYLTWDNAAYRYWRLIFSGFGSSFELYHVAWAQKSLLPWLSDGHDPDAYQTIGEHLIAPDGRHLGSIQQRTMRALSLDFGQVVDAEYTLFQLWADACVKTLKPCFYVPDSSQPGCYFGWVDSKYKFGAPYKNGMRDLAPITFNARVV